MLTEAPRKKQPVPANASAEAAATSRRSRYRNVQLKEVDDGYLPTANEFRAAGHKATMGNRRVKTPRGRMGSQAQQAAIWAKIQAGYSDAAENDNNGQQQQQHRNRNPEDGGNAQGTFLTGVDAGGVAEEGEGFYGDYEEGGALDDEARRRQAEMQELDQFGVPVNIFARSVERKAKPDPAKLRAAMKALRFALAHPMTSHSEVPSSRRGGWGEPMANRATRASIARQLPRQKFEPAYANDEVIAGDHVAGQSFAAVMEKKRNATKLLDRIESDLDGLAAGYEGGGRGVGGGGRGGGGGGRGGLNRSPSASSTGRRGPSAMGSTGGSRR